jgi:hypothetical protein
MEEISMSETLGTLNLKIARLEQQLWVLQQRQFLSTPYPNHRDNLIKESWRVEAALGELVKYRQQLAQIPWTI